MNKVIIVGHPASGFEEVESHLLKAGMKPALPSRREGVMPNDLTDTLCKAHQTPPVGSPTSESDFQQIEAGMVWHGLALDLLLGNLEQDLWGWADTQAIFLLDYWRKLDPQVIFVLVYDEPQRVLVEAGMQNAGELDELKIQPLLDNWMAYNGALLRFFLRNQGRCLLVNAQQVGLALDDYLKQLRARLSFSSHASDAALNVNELAASFDSETGPGTQSAPLALALHNALSLIGPATDEALKVVRADATWRYLIDEYLGGHPGYLQFFEELQSAANMPLAGAKARSSNPGLAWQAFVAQREFLATVLGRLHGKFNDLQEQSLRNAEENILSQAQLQLACEELESCHLEIQGLRDSYAHQKAASELLVAELQNKLARLHASHDELQHKLSQLHGAHDELQHKLTQFQLLQAEKEQISRENHHFASQLQQVRKDLESIRLENQELREQASRKDVEFKKVGEDLRQRQLEIEKLRTENEGNLRECQLNVLQIQQANEELQSNYSAIQQLRNDAGRREIEFKEAADGLQQRILLLEKENADLSAIDPREAAERVRQQLSYRIGSVMIAHSRSLTGWLGMPFAISREIRDFRRMRQIK